MIRNHSYVGDPPLWEMEIDPDKHTVLIEFHPEISSFEASRQAISELGSVLQMRLHEIARSCAREEK